MSNTVKYYHSDMPGAPVLNGTAGAMIGVLDACLVNGWAAGTVDSVVIADGVATVTRGAGHPFEADMVTELDGATVIGGSINGQHKISSAAGNSYSFPVPGLADQAAGGTITHKIAPLGWAKPFSGTNLAAYRSTDVSGTQFFLRLDDASATEIRYRGFESMTGIDSGTRPFPNPDQMGGAGFFGPKSSSAGSAARRWVLVGDQRTFYIAVNNQNNTSAALSLLTAFGDMLRAGSTDAYGAFIFGVTSTGMGSPGGNSYDMDVRQQASSGSLYAARPFSGVGQPVPLDRAYPTFRSWSASARRSGQVDVDHVLFPNGPDGGLYAVGWSFVEAGPQYRGQPPGIFAFPQQIGAAVFAHLEKLTPVAGLPGRKLMVINSQSGCFGFDITGPWS